MWVACGDPSGYSVTLQGMSWLWQTSGLHATVHATVQSMMLQMEDVGTGGDLGERRHIAGLGSVRWQSQVTGGKGRTQQCLGSAKRHGSGSVPSGGSGKHVSSIHVSICSPPTPWPYGRGEVARRRDSSTGRKESRMSHPGVSYLRGVASVPVGKAQARTGVRASMSLSEPRS